MSDNSTNGVVPDRNRAFFESYDCVRVRLPEHDLDFTCKPLLLRDAARFLRLMTEAQGGGTETERGLAMLRLLEEFPRAIEAEDELARLLPGELYDLVSVFFSLSRGNLGQSQTDSPTPPAGSPA